MTHFKTILRISLVLCIIVIAILAIVKMQSRSCSGIQVLITYSGENVILNEPYFIDLLDQNNIKTKGEKLNKINFDAVNKILSKEIYVQKINKIFISGTKLVIDITLREMLLHVFPNNGNPFFIDNEGMMIPFSKNIKENLIIVNGNIPVTFIEKKSILDNKSKLNSIYHIAKLIKQDPFYNQNFKQIFVNDKNIIEIVPTDGSLTILFGDESEAIEKLNKIKELYNIVLPHSADKKYSLIDVRFKNRVIAKKANI